MSRLGRLYSEGTIVKKDLEKSLYWYGKAIELGDSESGKKYDEIKARLRAGSD